MDSSPWTRSHPGRTQGPQGGIFHSNLPAPPLAGMAVRPVTPLADSPSQQLFCPSGMKELLIQRFQGQVQPFRQLQIGGIVGAQIMAFRQGKPAAHEMGSVTEGFKRNFAQKDRRLINGRSIQSSPLAGGFQQIRHFVNPKFGNADRCVSLLDIGKQFFAFAAGFIRQKPGSRIGGINDQTLHRRPSSIRFFTVSLPGRAWARMRRDRSTQLPELAERDETKRWTGTNRATSCLRRKIKTSCPFKTQSISSERRFFASKLPTTRGFIQPGYSARLKKQVGIARWQAIAQASTLIHHLPFSDEWTHQGIQPYSINGFFHFNPGKRVKSASAVCRIKPRSMANAARWASVVRLPAVPIRSSKFVRILKCCSEG